MVTYKKSFIFVQLFFNLLLNISGKTNCHNADLEIVLDVTNSSGDLRRIWANSGLSPPGRGNEAKEYLMSKEQFLNLAFIGCLPFKAITHVRIHWLLDLINVNSTGGESGPVFDFRLLDNLISWLKEFRMRPSFELMGNPGNLFSDLEYNQDKVHLWRIFVTDLAEHYLMKFGKEEVSKWRFELWNEPDSKQYNILNLTTDGYLRYAIASMEGLRVHGIKVSGPAGTFRDLHHHNISWGLLRYCSDLIIKTGSCDLETITFHKKGDSVPQKVVNSSVEFYSTATKLYPSLKSMPFANNEADILTGWWRREAWRGDVTYAAYVCDVVTSFLSEMEKGELPLAYISNDNGFINQPFAYFDQRTLLTRFQMNNSQDLHSQFVRKPVMIAMALLSYLGPKKIPIFSRYLNSNCDSRLVVLAGGDGGEVTPGWSAAILLSVSCSARNCSRSNLHLQLRLPPHADFKIVVYQLDNIHTNPRNVWERHGKPDFPSAEVLDDMRAHEGPYVTDEVDVDGGWQEMALQASSPSVTLVHLCRKSMTPPAKILTLKAINMTFNEVLLVWQDSNTRCVKTYEVYFCKGDCLTDEYELITTGRVIMLSYQFRAQSETVNVFEGTRGMYKIRVRNYWNILSEFSDSLQYP